MFARSKRSALKNWYPFTIMVGGSQANVLVKAKENEFTEKITGNTLAKTLGATLYKEQDKVVQELRLKREQARVMAEMIGARPETVRTEKLVEKELKKLVKN